MLTENVAGGGRREREQDAGPVRSMADPGGYDGHAPGLGSASTTELDRHDPYDGNSWVPSGTMNRGSLIMVPAVATW